MTIKQEITEQKMTMKRGGGDIRRRKVSVREQVYFKYEYINSQAGLCGGERYEREK